MCDWWSQFSYFEDTKVVVGQLYMHTNLITTMQFLGIMIHGNSLTLYSTRVIIGSVDQTRMQLLIFTYLNLGYNNNILLINGTL